MPDPTPIGAASSLDWAKALNQTLGAQLVDVSKITGRPWIQLDLAFLRASMNKDEDSWEPMSGDHPSWNKVTIYRFWQDDQNAQSFHVIRGSLPFFDGGDDSSHHHGQSLVAESQKAISAIDANDFLNAESFTRASDVFFNTSWWLSEVGQPEMVRLANQISKGGAPSDGSAADALAWAMRDLALGMQGLQDNITKPENWATNLDDNAAEINKFKAAMREAWQGFTAPNYKYTDPAWLVLEICKSMVEQAKRAAIALEPVVTNDIYNQPWYFSFPDQGLPEQYDLATGAGWERLNNDVKNSWITEFEKLNDQAEAASQSLIASFDRTWRSLGRAVLPLQSLPYPGSDDLSLTPDDDPPDINDLLPNIGDNSGADGPDTSLVGGGGSFDPPALDGAGGADVDPGFGQSLVGGGGSFDPPALDGAGGSGNGASPALFGAGAGPLITGGRGVSSLPGRQTGGGFTRIGGPGESAERAASASGPQPLDLSAYGFEGGSDPAGTGAFVARGSNGGGGLGPLGTPPAGYTGSVAAVPPGATLLAGGAGAVPSAAGVGGAPGVPGTGAGYPFCPPMAGMGGMGGQASERERERNIWLTEEPDVWGTDHPKVAPAVVGRDEYSETPSSDRPARQTTPSRSTGTPFAPARERTR